MSTPPPDQQNPFGKTRLGQGDVLQDGDKVMVSLRNVHKTYLLGVEGVPALRGVSVSVDKGEFVCIYGTSGGGKSTLLNIIGTIDRPTKGEMFLCGTHITPRTPDSVLASTRLHQMGFVFQTFNLLGALTALENVELPMVLLGKMGPAERRKRARDLLGMVGLGDRTNHLPSQLSGGEQQRVTIARALANEPKMLLLDEPTGDLDTRNTALVMKLLVALNKEKGITLVMVTHDVGLKGFADRVVWMRDGLVQRLEVVDPRQRDEALAQAEVELASKKMLANRSIVQSFVSDGGGANTEIREPMSYEPLLFAKAAAEAKLRGVAPVDLLCTAAGSRQHHKAARRQDSETATEPEFEELSAKVDHPERKESDMPLESAEH